jgi:hypothetical protein
MEDPTLLNSQKVAHRVEYRLNALLSRVIRLFELFEPVNEHVEEFARKNPKETADLVFHRRHRHRRHLVQSQEVVGSLDQYWANIDTIQHLLLVCNVAERQVSIMESVMQAAMGGHVSVTAVTELNYARIALKIGREAKDAGLEPVARHLSDYLQMETSFVAGSEGFSTLVHVPLIDRTGGATTTMEGSGAVLVALFARQFKLATPTCRMSIGGTEAAMRMVAPDAFGSYTNKPHRGTVTCRGNNNPGGPETRAFTANGLTKITLPHGCTAETDTHIFAAADDGFRRSDNDYTISYVWPFDPLTLTPGLDTKLFSDILKKNLTSLANITRHNIPLEIALQAVGANGAVPVDLTSLLDGHHYVTVPVMTTVIITILVGSVIGGVVITRVKGDQRENRHNYTYLKQEFAIMKKAVQNRESREEEEESRPRKPTALQPPSYRPPVLPPYAAAGRGQPGYSTSSPAGRPGYSLGASPSLVTDLQANKESTAGHSLGMQRDQAAAMLGGFQMGRDQVPVNNFPRAAPTAIDMTTMMARQ